MISTIFQTIGEAITSFTNALSSGLTGVVSIFYNNTEGNLTVLGVLLLIGVGCGVVYWAFRLIRGLIKNPTR